MGALTATLSQNIDAVDKDAFEALEKAHRENEQAVIVNAKLADDISEQISKFAQDPLADTRAMTTLLDRIDEHRRALHLSAEARRRALDDLSSFLSYSRDCHEMQAFIAASMETARRTEYLDLTLAGSAAEVQARLAKEIKSQSAILNAIVSKRQALTEAENLHAQQIEVLANTLKDEWAELEKSSEERGKNIKEAVTFIEWQDQVDRIRSSLQQKRAVVEVSGALHVRLYFPLTLSLQAAKIGSSQGECASLEVSFSDFRNTVVADVARAQVSRTASEKLLQVAPTFSSQIKTAIESLSDETSQMEDFVQTHDQKLKLAKRTHAYLDDCAALESRLAALAKRLAVDDVGTTVLGARALIQNVSTIEHDFVALQPTVQSALDDGVELSKQPMQDLSADIATRCDGLRAQRETITHGLDHRRTALENAVQLFDFEDKCRDFESWDRSMLQAIQAEKPVASVEDAAVVMKRHQGRLREISARKENFEILQTRGKDLLVKKHPMSDKVCNCFRESDYRRYAYL